MRKKVTIRHLIDTDIQQIFPLAKLCAVPDYYIILDTNKEFYEDIAGNHLSLGAFDKDMLIAFLLYRVNSDSLEGFIEKCDVLRELKASELMEHGVEIMNSCVHPEYRGHHLEKKLIAKAIKESLARDPDAWFWATSHKDNIASSKAVMDNGFQVILRDIEMPYIHIATHRNIYLMCTESVRSEKTRV